MPGQELNLGLHTHTCVSSALPLSCLPDAIGGCFKKREREASALSGRKGKKLAQAELEEGRDPLTVYPRGPLTHEPTLCLLGGGGSMLEQMIGIITCESFTRTEKGQEAVIHAVLGGQTRILRPVGPRLYQLSHSLSY